MDAQFLDALADILADALLADLEAELAEEQAVTAATAESPRGSGSQAEDVVAPLTLTRRRCAVKRRPIVARAS